MLAMGEVGVIVRNLVSGYLIINLTKCKVKVDLYNFYMLTNTLFFQCYIRCVLEMVEIASADGQFDASRAEPALSSIRGVRVLSDVAETAATCAADRSKLLLFILS